MPEVIENVPDALIKYVDERMTFRRITYENGQLISVHCCGQNISLEKKAQEKYERVRRRLSRKLRTRILQRSRIPLPMRKFGRNFRIYSTAQG